MTFATVDTGMTTPGAKYSFDEGACSHENAVVPLTQVPFLDCNSWDRTSQSGANTYQISSSFQIVASTGSKACTAAQESTSTDSASSPACSSRRRPVTRAPRSAFDVGKRRRSDRQTAGSSLRGKYARRRATSVSSQTVGSFNGASRGALPPGSSQSARFTGSKRMASPLAMEGLLGVMSSKPG